MVTQEEAIKYYMNYYNSKAVYVWGMNGDIISESTIQQAYKYCGNSNYPKSYYDAKLIEGKGRIGSDCSGMHFHLSGKDMTAQSYYNKCRTKGNIQTLPRNEVVLLFRGKSSSICHTGIYLGNGMCLHMKSSKENCVYEKVENHAWTYWGKPDWIDYSINTIPDYNKYTHANFILEVQTILGTGNRKELLSKSPTISTTTNKKNALVTPLERYMKALGYYSGEVEADIGSIPVFGKGMSNAIKQYQKEIVKANEVNCDGILSHNGATYKTLYGLK